MRCPVCKAENTESVQCRRCRADLALLVRLEERRQAVLAVAYRAVAGGHWRRALVLAEGADTLRSDDESLRLVAVSYLLRRDFARAWECYRRQAGT